MVRGIWGSWLQDGKKRSVGRHHVQLHSRRSDRDPVRWRALPPVVPRQERHVVRLGLPVRRQPILWQVPLHRVPWCHRPLLCHELRQRISSDRLDRVQRRLRPSDPAARLLGLHWRSLRHGPPVRGRLRCAGRAADSLYRGGTVLHDPPQLLLCGNVAGDPDRNQRIRSRWPSVQGWFIRGLRKAVAQEAGPSLARRCGSLVVDERHERQSVPLSSPSVLAVPGCAVQ